MERNSLVSNRRWWTLGVLCLSLLVIGLDNTILNVALPTLARDLDASSSQLQWIVDAYMLVFAGVLLTAGALGDRFGRKRALTLGLAVFGAGSIASALSSSAEMLIASRGLMGIGGAFIMPSTLSILTATFRDPAERAKAIGVWAGVSGLGIAIGPVTGGWLIQHASWHWIFLVNVPFVLLALAAGRFLVPESRDPAAPRLDLCGFALSAAGLTALVWGIIEAPTRGWTDPLVLGALAGATVVLAAFVAWELRAPAPMLDVRLFRKPRFSAASAAISLAFFALFGLIFFLTQYLQSILGYDALEAGLRTMPVAGGLILGGPASAKLAARIGTKVVVAAGLALVGVALLLLTGADAASGYGLVLASLLVLGFGMGCAMAPATEAIMGALPLAKASVGSAVNDTTRTTGGALGVAVLGSVLSGRYRGAMDHAVAGLPDRAAGIAHDSLAGALAVAQRVGGAPGGRLASAAQDAFLSGMHAAALVAAGVAFAGALVALAYLPARAAAPAGEPRAVPA
ncbi:MAG TPA: MFS transporter [Solirubrobacteraceae bacterium]